MSRLRPLAAQVAVGVSALIVAPCSWAVTFNPGDLFIADANAFGGSGGVAVLRQSCSPSEVSSGGSFVTPSGITVDLNQIKVADPSAFGGPGGIIGVSPDTGAQFTIASGAPFVDPTGVDQSGILLVADSGTPAGSGSIFSSGTSLFASGAPLVDPVDLFRAPDLSVFVADRSAFGGPGGILRYVNRIGDPPAIVSSGGSFVDPQSLALGPDGFIYVADRSAFGGSGGVIRVNPGTGAQTTISSGGFFVDPFGIDVAPNGDIFVADRGAPGGTGDIIKVDPVTGAQDDISCGSLLVDPMAIAMSDAMRFDAPPGPNSLVLRRSGSNLVLTNNGLTVASGPLAYARGVFLFGSAGDDSLTVDYSGGPFTIPNGIFFGPGAGTDRVFVKSDADFVVNSSSVSQDGARLVDWFSGQVEGVTLSAGPSSNVIDASAFAGSVAVSAGAGDDVLVGASGADTLVGQSGDDSLDGGPGSDTLDAGSGNDDLSGGADDDLLRPGPGDDFVDGGAGSDELRAAGDVNFQLSDDSFLGLGIDTLFDLDRATLTGGAGDNVFTVSGWSGMAALDGKAGIGDRVVSRNDANLTLTDGSLTRSSGGSFTLAGIEEAQLAGGPSANTLDASAFTLGPVTLDGSLGNDVLKGGSSDDVVFGASGNDTLTGKAGDDVIDGASGTDRLVETANTNQTLTDSKLFGPGEDFLTSIERATLSGGSGNNTLDARTFVGPVTLNGAGGADTLQGSPFADTLTGGTGADTMNGFDGADTFNALDGSVDTIDGGNDTDACNCDPGDVVTNVP